MDERLKPSDEEAILKDARHKFKLAVDAESENRSESLDDLEFLSGEQWTNDAKKARAGRPCLTINRLPNVVRSAINEQRKTRPSIDVIPADGQSSKETADVLQGLIRGIERASRAYIAYDTGYKYAVSCGIGHWRITTAYVDDDSFDQEIRIERITNPFTVYRDPNSTQPDHSDDKFTFVTELVDRETFKEKYGQEPKSFEDVGLGDEMAPWFEGDKIRVAEYWCVKEEETEIHQLPTGEKLEGKLTKEVRDALFARGVTEQMIRTRSSKKRKVVQYLMTCGQILKTSEWKGKYIPIASVIGDELNLEGRQKLESLTRFAKDPARMYNYWASAETELVALQPKAPWIGAAGSFDGYESEWMRANTESLAYLTYNPVPGQPPPQRQFFAGVPVGVREGRMAAAEDIKAVTGIYDASLGARSNETSGVAIRAREEQGDNAVYHFVANQALAIEFTGKIILDLAPHIYDTARVVQIVTPTNEQQMVAINQVFIDPATGQEKMYDLTQGRYAVTVRVGPSFESKRQEMVQSMIELSTANPQLMQLAGDLVVQNMDWPQSEEIAERIKQMQQQAQQPKPDPAQELLKAQTEQQMQIGGMKGQVAQMKARADLQLKRLDVQMKQIELAIKEKEAQIKGAEVQVKAYEMEVRAMEAQAKASMPVMVTQ